MQQSKVKPLVVIIGATATGKSALALDIAQKFNGEIIAADSRTVYKGMDIGTAKPSKAEQALAPHHLLDIVSPDESFNVSAFQGQALETIGGIGERGKLPILAGGTGLYIDSVIFDYAFSQGNAEKDEQNPRHLKKSATTQAQASLRANTLVIGLLVPKEELEKRIIGRVEKMILKGLEHEVKNLGDIYGWEAEAMTGVGYREWQAYFNGTQTLEETKQLITIHTRQYAKRQRAWFKRNKYIQWVSTPEEAVAVTEQFLAKQPASWAHSLLQCMHDRSIVWE